MKVIGVTGGVGAGKSEVLGYIAGNWNATVVEADEVGYLVMRPGKACYSAIVDLFGAGILKEDETLDREQIAKIVFEDKEMLAKMNAIVHPAVKEYIRKAIKREEENETDIFIVEAALRIEDKYDEICDELWYIYADEETRMERLKQNRGCLLYTSDSSGCCDRLVEGGMDSSILPDIACQSVCIRGF